MATEPVPTVRAASGPLREVAALFLKLGVIGFGGPTAHIAMMEEEVVRRRRWLRREHFLDALAVTNMVPGPNSTEMAIHLGYLRAGVLGGVVAGLCFIGPAFLLMLVLSWAYVQYGTLPAVGALFWGVKPVVVAIIIAAAYRLARNALTSPWPPWPAWGRRFSREARSGFCLGPGFSAIFLRAGGPGSGWPYRWLRRWPWRWPLHPHSWLWPGSASRPAPSSSAGAT